MEKILEIKNLHVSVEGKEILKGVNLTMNKGELHAIMGTNGSGKSTLAMTLMGHPRYTITQGEILFQGENINTLPVDERAKRGLYLSMQHPTEIEGVRLGNLMWQSSQILNKVRSNNVIDFMKELKTKAHALGMPENFTERSVNHGFSGGEKKKTEILQMLTLKPSFAIIDEVDSGLDMDSLKTVAEQINAQKDGTFSGLLVTHYQRIFDHLQPDFIHIMSEGKIVKTGTQDIVKEIEQSGYSSFDKE